VTYQHSHTANLHWLQPCDGGELRLQYSTSKAQVSIRMWQYRLARGEQQRIIQAR
jgi:hypothetical protein